ncbi:lipocalin family protein [Flavobacterium sp.]|uniref:lipocalin family protein n=1 Tax=Flavobacterium sp. TaxID=239 RepID=UPI0025C213E0|nr:lipocalin family protein [Flavobacterium sp.]MBA4153513.1 hypothetical protein [Flavobacterium sp.]
MKKLLLLLSFVAVSLTSCSNDDDSSSSVAVNETNLMKKWYYVSYEVAGQTIPYDNLECGRDYIQFKANDVVEDYYVNSCDPLDADTDLGTWSLSGNTVSATFFGTTVTGTVSSLTATTLQITDTFDFDDDGTDETVKINYSTN